MEVTQYNLSGMTINQTDADMSWRLVHDGTSIISLFQSSAVTHSVYTIFLAATEEECQTEIYSLNLE